VGAVKALRPDWPKSFSVKFHTFIKTTSVYLELERTEKF
jgi:hypothetical protein